MQTQKEQGNYIMYARATSGDKRNNNKFSVCSIRNISRVLEKKRGDCFVGKYGRGCVGVRVWVCGRGCAFRGIPVCVQLGVLCFTESVCLVMFA